MLTFAILMCFTSFILFHIFQIHLIISTNNAGLKENVLNYYSSNIRILNNRNIYLLFYNINTLKLFYFIFFLTTYTFLFIVSPNSSSLPRSRNSCPAMTQVLASHVLWWEETLSLRTQKLITKDLLSKYTW